MAKTEKNKKVVQKSAICILAGRDSEEKNSELARLLAFILNRADREPKSEFKALLDNYFFIFADGTFNRMFVNREYPPTSRGYFWDFWYELYPPKNALKNHTLTGFFNENCICMHGYRTGGIILFANMVVTQHCSIIWPFLDPHEAHCTRVPGEGKEGQTFKIHFKRMAATIDNMAYRANGEPGRLRLC